MTRRFAVKAVGCLAVCFGAFAAAAPAATILNETFDQAAAQVFDTADDNSLDHNGATVATLTYGPVNLASGVFDAPGWFFSLSATALNHAKLVTVASPGTGNELVRDTVNASLIAGDAIRFRHTFTPFNIDSVDAIKISFDYRTIITAPTGGNQFTQVHVGNMGATNFTDFYRVTVDSKSSNASFNTYIESALTNAKADSAAGPKVSDGQKLHVEAIFDKVDATTTNASLSVTGDLTFSYASVPVAKAVADGTMFGLVEINFQQGSKGAIDNLKIETIDLAGVNDWTSR